MWEDIFILFGAAILCGFLVKRYHRPIVTNEWSIAVFATDGVARDSRFIQRIPSPNLRASDVTDAAAELVADPFLVMDQDRYYLFFEVYNKITEKGEIAVAISDDRLNWRYDKLVLVEKFHLSYPQVFKWQEEYYMLPETIESGKVQLYKAKIFPYEWEPVSQLLDRPLADPSLFHYQDKWWMYAGTPGNLHLFSSPMLESGWVEHPQSPLITNDDRVTRPGGRIVVYGDDIYRYAQSGIPYYGKSVSAFRVTLLNDTEYEEVEEALVLEGTGGTSDWQRDGMHHIDQIRLSDQEWLVTVDGHRGIVRHYLRWKWDRWTTRLQWRNAHKRGSSGGETLNR
ncbi:hypothetical protein [Cohnella soli]|uniref:Glucosamine inositolphosphorylceramide transferase 1 N-terminal domain-containing protein n=1 Tax=Cohnella soli TaxID=425005 RepID=A0ABW0HZV6_9BACL